MNLSEALDLSARMMARAGHLIDAEQMVEDKALHHYWIYSRDLANHWQQNLSICQKVLAQGDPIRSRQCWLEYEPDLREILRADLLHRSWYTILQAVDSEKNVCHCEPISRSVLSSQMQIRTRALRLILSGYQIDAARMSRLNEIRKSAEAWSDLICSHLAIRYGIQGILFDEKRAARWGKQPLEHLLPELSLSVEQSRPVDRNWNRLSQLQDTNRLDSLQKLARTMIDCFPPSAFDQDGILRPA